MPPFSVVNGVVAPMNKINHRVLTILALNNHNLYHMRVDWHLWEPPRTCIIRQQKLSTTLNRMKCRKSRQLRMSAILPLLQIIINNLLGIDF